MHPLVMLQMKKEAEMPPEPPGHWVECREPVCVHREGDGWRWYHECRAGYTPKTTRGATIRKTYQEAMNGLETHMKRCKGHNTPIREEKLT